MKRILFAIIFLLCVSTVYAQPVPIPTANGGNKLGWDQSAPTLDEAKGYIYRYYPDAAANGTALTSVSCVGATSPYQCEAPFPAFTPGNHTLTLTAGFTIAGGGMGMESAKSEPLSFTFVIVPAVPANLSIKK